MVTTSSTATEAMGGGFIVFGICSFWGLRLLLRGLRNDVLDTSGFVVASRRVLIIGGVLLQLPVIGFAVFVWKLGQPNP